MTDPVTVQLLPELEEILLERARKQNRDPGELLIEIVTRELDAQDADPERRAAFIARLKAR
jgi:hypothetical protein